MSFYKFKSIARLINYCADFLLLIIALLYKFISFDFSFFPKKTKKSQRVLAILGNGPSLKKDLIEINKLKNELDFCAVNNFANTDLFYQLKPSTYVIVDPVFWRSDVNKNFAESNSLLLKNLLNIHWPMVLVCGEGGFDVFQDHLRDNPNVTVHLLQDRWIDLRSKKVNISALRFRLMTPNFVNVLIAALWHAMINGRKNIHIYGADFSSFKAFEVDQQTNIVSTEYSHFYTEGLEKQLVEQKYVGMKPKNISTRLNQVTLSFREMYFLSRLAYYWNVKIINRSVYSLLDCFQRK